MEPRWEVQFSYVFDIYIVKPKSWLIEASRRSVQNSYVCKLWYTEKKKN